MWNALCAALPKFSFPFSCVSACARCCCFVAAAAWTAIALRLLRTLQLAADPELTIESVQSCSLSFLFRRIASGGVDGEKKGKQKGRRNGRGGRRTEGRKEEEEEEEERTTTRRTTSIRRMGR